MITAHAQDARAGVRGVASANAAGGGARVPGRGLGGAVGTSPAMRSALALALRVAQHPATTVLIAGETGTGKELFARWIHYAGPAETDPFVAINCAAIPENLLESELFGHERGAFTGADQQKRGLFEFAGRGTVFLDEIGEMPAALQPKLLRVLEERCIRRVGALREYDVQCRIIAATNRDLAGVVAAGQFREDLYYRLNVFRLELPPLRERGSDLDLLADEFVEALCRQHGLPRMTLSPQARAVLQAHGWPGNVRELKNTIERAVILAEGDRIEVEHILIQHRANLPAQVAGAGESAPRAILVPPEGLTLEEAERRLIELTLDMTGRNQSHAARILGLSRPTIVRKIRKFKLNVRPEEE